MKHNVSIIYYYLEDLNSVSLPGLSEISAILDFGLLLPCFYLLFYYKCLHPKNILFSLKVYVLNINGIFLYKLFEIGSSFDQYILLDILCCG